MTRQPRVAASRGSDTVDVLWRSQAQPPPTMYISWQGRYTDNLHVVTSSASLIFMSRISRKSRECDPCHCTIFAPLNNRPVRACDELI
ncbi:hypothetical protein EEB14_58820 [Rhodococcus sp. WS4]|nr:hypothetical protein EEB14_58820 [Rhodococcus sp. WS4]